MKTFTIATVPNEYTGTIEENATPYITGFATHPEARALANDLNNQRAEGVKITYVVLSEAQPDPAGPRELVIPPLCAAAGKPGKLSTATRRAIEWALTQTAPGDGIRRVLIKASARRWTYSYPGDLVEILVSANGFNTRLKNDAPRGGRGGDYFEAAEGWREFCKNLLNR